MPKITAKESKLMNTVRRAFDKTTADVTFSQLLQATRLDSVSLTSALVLLEAEEENGFWYLPAEKVASVAKPTVDVAYIPEMPEEPSIDDEEMPSLNESAPSLINPNTGREYIEMPETGNVIKNQILQAVAEMESRTPAKKPRTRRFTPNPILGYKAEPTKVQIFLDRRACSHTLTLSLEDAKELVSAIEKAERMA